MRRSAKSIARALNPLIVPWAMALGMAGAIWYPIRRDDNLIHHGRQAVGSVVDVREVLVPEEKISWSPVISVEHAGGRFQIVGRPREHRPNVRERVTVFYDAGNLPGALIAGDERTWVSAVGHCVVLTLFVIVLVWMSVGVRVQVPQRRHEKA